MSIGQMRYFLTLYRKTITTDDAGFQTETNPELATVRAYREGRHGSEKWASMATFSDATELFRFRAIPGIAVTTEMIAVCGEARYEILSVEEVNGRGMYVEILCREVKESG